jgi:CheY-like chemotaxis protein
VVPFPAAVVAFPVVPIPVSPFQDAEPPPLSQSLAVPAEITRVTIEKSGETPAETSLLAAEIPPPTVLLVDEDAAMRKLLAMLLNREGYTVRHAADSGEAIAELSENGIDVVIANLNDDEQPVVIRKWRSAHPELSIIALSSGMETKAALNGAHESNLLTLPLPSRPRNVVQAVQALLDLSRIEPARIEPSRATRCAPPSFAHTPRTAIGLRP